MKIKKPRFRRADIRRLCVRHRPGGWRLGDDMFAQTPKRIRSNWVLQIKSAFDPEIGPIQSTDGRVFLLQKTPEARPSRNVRSRVVLLVCSALAAGLVVLIVPALLPRSESVDSTEHSSDKRVNLVSPCDEAKSASLDRISEIAAGEHVESRILAEIGGLQHVLIKIKCVGESNLNLEVYRVSREGAWKITKILQSNKQLEDLGK